MNEGDVENDLLAIDRALTGMGRRVEIDRGHRARLRRELLGHHRRVIEIRAQKAIGLRRRAKRLMLAAPVALVAALVVTMALWSLPFNGHQPTQLAQAAHLTRALAQTAPTVTGWRWTVRSTRGSRTSVYRLGSSLRPGERVYIRSDRVYLYSNGSWSIVTESQPISPSDRSTWQWAFAVLPARLADHAFTILPSRTVKGRHAEGVRFSVTRAGSVMRITAWIDLSSGLVRRLDRTVLRNGRVSERDSVDYAYQRSP